MLIVREEPIPFDELTLKLTGKKKFTLTATDLCRATVKKNRNLFKKGGKPSPLAALAALIQANRPDSMLSADLPTEPPTSALDTDLTEG